MELTARIPPLHRKSCRSPLLRLLAYLLKKPKIAAVTAAAQRFCARKSRACAVRRRSRHPRRKTADTAPDSRFPGTPCARRHLVIDAEKCVLSCSLCALPQVGGTHDFEKTIAVNPIKSRHRLHFRRESVLFCCHPVHHVRPHVRKGFLRRQLCLQHLCTAQCAAEWSAPVFSSGFGPVCCGFD